MKTQLLPLSTLYKFWRPQVLWVRSYLNHRSWHQEVKAFPYLRDTWGPCVPKAHNGCAHLHHSRRAWSGQCQARGQDKGTCPREQSTLSIKIAPCTFQ